MRHEHNQQMIGRCNARFGHRRAQRAQVRNSVHGRPVVEAPTLCKEEEPIKELKEL